MSHSAEVGSRFEIKCPFQVKFVNQTVHRCWSVFTLYLTQNQTHGVAVVAAAKTYLLRYEFFGLVDCHVRIILPSWQSGRIPPSFFRLNKPTYRSIY